MNLIYKTASDMLLPVKSRLSKRKHRKKYTRDELPLRSELFNSDQMKEHGKNLADLHQLTGKKTTERLLERLHENEEVLIETTRQLTAVVKENNPIAPAEEWLLDNFYLIEENVRTAKRHLSRGFSRGLPWLASGPSAGLPRAYDIAQEIISHGDGRVDLENLVSFVTAYQSVSCLKLGELWAIPIMLRLALIENLRRIGTRIMADVADRARANYWADQMVDVAARDPKSLVLTIADMARSDPPLLSSFVAEFARRLQGKSPALALPLSWIEQRLSESHLTIEQMIQAGNQQLAADQASVSNSIGSLRFLTTMDWREFVETMSVVEKVLREDPSDVYIRMDFATRDHYRHVVEKIAKNSQLFERDVAELAIGMAREAVSAKTGDERMTHVGFYLTDKGLPELEKRARMRLSLSETVTRAFGRVPLLLYLGSIILITLLLSGYLLIMVRESGLPSWVMLPAAAVLVLGASSLGVSLTNWLATLFTRPQPLPRMDFSMEIPPEASTLVVIPTMLSDVQSAEDLLEALEIRFLTNRANNLHFGLLTDFCDAPHEKMPEDDEILRLAEKGIKELHEKYRGVKGGTFYLFHRPRLWNAEEGIWMGYERKRGKLADLNMFLRDGVKDRFSKIVGATELLSNIKYVITLDTDTQLPRDAAEKFIGTMAHPLNHPLFDESKKIVCAGYGILQPRLTESLSGARQTRYSRLWGDQTGIDPYTRMVSDVYQDIFGEGSYVGKGIYDVDAFEKALHNRLPENRILSHDLIEGCHARSGLISDVELFEEYPASYQVDVKRRHRWIRGDWQIAGWIRSRVPVLGGSYQVNAISKLSQWKIFDNLRRSLVPAALTIMMIAGWTMLPQTWLWTLLVACILFIPSASALTLDLFRKPGDVLLRDHMAYMLRQTGRRILQIVFTVACLPYEACYSLDAMMRTLWRMLISHKRLLEWNPFHNNIHHARNGLAESCRTMWISPLLSTAVFAYLIWSARPGALCAAFPVLVLWFLSPAIAWWVSRPAVKEGITLKDEQIVFLRKAARRTWAFFETFVTAGDNWLPPDNYQEYPGAVIAHRTSPTNIGLSLLANLTACDFHYITPGEFVRRTDNTLDTMGKMDRFRGHFYNWYDTQTLKILPPHYISTVDSGNLCGYLLILKRGLQELSEKKIVGDGLLTGITDTFNVFQDVAEKMSKKELDGFKNQLGKPVSFQQVTANERWRLLDGLAKSTSDIAATFEGDLQSQAYRWARALVSQCRDAANELMALCPWVTLDIPSDRCGSLVEEIGIPTLQETADLPARWLAAFNEKIGSGGDDRERAWSAEFTRKVSEGSVQAKERLTVINNLIKKTEELADMDYSFLYDKGRQLLTIGYSVGERRRDTSYYDLLASEARFCSFVAIAQGQLPKENWFALGRMLTNPGGEPVLLAWDGSMFEYLMPLLVMPNYENTLLDQTYKAAVKSQIVYGEKRGILWGISESGYNNIDVHLNYQYRAFGVPGLGLKRGLADDLVVAPYASALALMVAPREACENLQRLHEKGMTGAYGFYEALDYTASRLQSGQTSVAVRSFMAHHQGMTLLSMAHLLLNCPMQKRFESEPMFQSTALLLQERIPKAVSFYKQIVGDINIRKPSGPQKIPARIYRTPDTPLPEVQLLSNGRYHVMVTQAGGGYSRWKDLAVTRWREDATRDPWGMFCYIRDISTGEYWSTAYQPTLKQPDRYEAIFSDSKVEFRRRDDDINTYTQIAVSPEDDIELRRIRITNRSRKRRELDVTSYAEIVMAQPAADEIHPAFSNLFVQTEIIPDHQAILSTRRPRSENDPAYWNFHLMALQGKDSGEASYETDRLKFVGRGNTLSNPQAMKLSVEGSNALSGTEGSVLDPVVSIRRTIRLAPGESVTVDIVSGMAETRAKTLGLVEKYRDRRLADRVFNLAWTHSELTLRQINATQADAQLYGRLVGSVVYANASLRTDPKIIVKNHRGQSGLWGYAISGDLPIVLLQIGDHANIELARQLQQAHAYWRLKGLAVDLIIWNEDNATYRQSLHDQIVGLIATSMETRIADKPGGIFVRSGDQISNEDRILMQTVARVIIRDDMGTLEEQLNRRQIEVISAPPLKPVKSPGEKSSTEEPLSYPGLIYDNGLGGFTPDGREYVIVTKPGRNTPLPWVNVIANPHFGSIVSESGSACTWSENAHEYRLTPWNNDPVSDASGEAFYIRDEETGHVWSPTPLPVQSKMPYICRHGFGYSVFTHTEDGIHSELWVYVSISAPVKFMVLKFRNESGRNRALSVTGYLEWVLGDLRSKTMMHVTTDVDKGSGALFTRNQYNTDFADRVVFFDVDDPTRTITGDRNEFIGRNREMSAPAAMARSQLSGRVGAGLDPCGAIQVTFGLNKGQEREVIFRLGVTGRRGADDASNMVRGLRGSTVAKNELEAVQRYWQKTLGTIQIETPDPSLDILTNGWLLYQTLSCRLWARNGYYQSGGAFGFRDQLQDVMALVYARPALVRQHLLLCAGRQFPEGDVQHWWHPPTGRGVRTQCSDDYLWLPLVTARYVDFTGDTEVLGENINFLEGRQVREEEDSYYDLPDVIDKKSSLYDHCVRAVRRGLRFGSHGLPLMGTGDWNDGMNKVGEKGTGESIWLGFFIHDVLIKFAGIAIKQGDQSFADLCRQEAVRLKENIERSGWDGNWYRRAYCDDGCMLGSCSNTECRIDSIAQSWSVLSGAADPERARQAMREVDRTLVNREDKLVKLLAPPFDQSEIEPGYIKGYVPGVRENGGQYTHAAIWAAMAFAALGDRVRAWDVLNIINPINHAGSPEEVDVYKVEPYVVASDVYSSPPHVGRGGWTWLSGSAAWMYRLIVESLLGLSIQKGRIRFAPCLPPEWKELKIHYRYGETLYHMVLRQYESETERPGLILDGMTVTGPEIVLMDDHREHTIEVNVWLQEPTVRPPGQFPS
ncbi:MAG: N,N'-diacetylchitobiose phosphorylase [Deltaproteobacteria bacterium ADurb.Bin151]|nr:MAG: N,N'-diacetylchitobiose phosphorylase [Deltaproteobacteria bacterium ADurb.Bin151]